MTPELIISLISLVLSTTCSILTILVNIKISKLNNLEAIHKYQKKITPFELTFKDKKWLLDLIDKGEFGNYDENSQTIMKAWYKKICQEEAAKEHLEQEAFIKQAKAPIRPTGRTGRGSTIRIPILPTRDEMFSSGIPVEVVIPGKEEVVNIKALEEIRNQYNINDTESIPETKELEFDFDELLAANTELKNKEDR